MVAGNKVLFLRARGTVRGFEKGQTQNIIKAYNLRGKSLKVKTMEESRL